MRFKLEIKRNWHQLSCNGGAQRVFPLAFRRACELSNPESMYTLGASLGKTAAIEMTGKRREEIRFLEFPIREKMSEWVPHTREIGDQPREFWAVTQCVRETSDHTTLRVVWATKEFATITNRTRLTWGSAYVGVSDSLKTAICSRICYHRRSGFWLYYNSVC